MIDIIYNSVAETSDNDVPCTCEVYGLSAGPYLNA